MTRGDPVKIVSGPFRGQAATFCRRLTDEACFVKIEGADLVMVYLREIKPRERRIHEKGI
jgi:ribosomal protein L24